ncbi:hypothetical protein HZS_5303 [Henneguya salminicola]|nr:hypothetical protein HZS_5303 [Henneguya salminicola]
MLKNYSIMWQKASKTILKKSIAKRDIVELINSACKKLNLKILGYALIENTIGTLLCGALENTETVIAINNGIEINACYIEKIYEVTEYGDFQTINKKIIDSELEAFGEKEELNTKLTELDLIVDFQSINPGKQLFDKIVSGMYLGEIVRLI